MLPRDFRSLDAIYRRASDGLATSRPKVHCKPPRVDCGCELVYAGLAVGFGAGGLGISKTAGSMVLFTSILFTVMLKENCPPKSKSMEYGSR